MSDGAVHMLNVENDIDQPHSDCAAVMMIGCCCWSGGTGRPSSFRSHHCCERSMQRGRAGAGPVRSTGASGYWRETYPVPVHPEPVQRWLLRRMPGCGLAGRCGDAHAPSCVCTRAGPTLEYPGFFCLRLTCLYLRDRGGEVKASSTRRLIPPLLVVLTFALDILQLPCLSFFGWTRKRRSCC